MFYQLSYYINNKSFRSIGSFCCVPAETRTLDPLIKSQLLYQLSYGDALLFRMLPCQDNFQNSFRSIKDCKNKGIIYVSQHSVAQKYIKHKNKGLIKKHLISTFSNPTGNSTHLHELLTYQEMSCNNTYRPLLIKILNVN